MTEFPASANLALAALEDLGTQTALLVRRWYEAGTISPSYERGLVQHYEDFRYDADGLHYGGIRGEDVTIPNWERAGLQAFQAVDRPEVIGVVKGQLRPYFKGDDQLESALAQYVMELARECISHLSRAEETGSDISSVVSAAALSRQLTHQFASELFDPSPRAWAEAELQGISILSQSLMFSLGSGIRVELRPITKEDLEQPRRVSPHQGTLSIFRRRPSAILRVEYPVGENGQVLIHQLVWAFRLFRLGGIIVPFEEYHSGRFLRSHGHRTTHAEGIGSVIEQYSLRETDAARVSQKIPELALAIPASLWNGPADTKTYLEIALVGFEEALLRTGTSERRVATAVMGLESLLLDGEGELKYRLSLRCSVLLGALGHDPLRVRDVMQCAYNIRSKYVHGVGTNQGLRKKMEELAGSTLEFGRLIVDYLRIAIGSFLLADISKKKMLELLDDGLLDEDTATTLQVALSPMVPIGTTRTGQ